MKENEIYHMEFYTQLNYQSEFKINIYSDMRALFISQKSYFEKSQRTWGKLKMHGPRVENITERQNSGIQ